MRKLLTVFAAVAALCAPFAAVAEYPEKPVQFVVPFPPGDLEDILTRMIADEFQKTYGVATSVANKPGGGGGPFPGAAEVAKAKPDGYTIGSFVVGIPVVGPQVGIPALNPDPFDPIGIFLTYPFVIAAQKDAPYDSMESLAKYAKNNDVALGHFGSFLIPTQVTFALASKMGFEYSSEAAFDALDCNTLASGDADVINTTLQLILPCLNDLNVLASFGDQRIGLTPNTRAIGEFQPDLNLALWNGLFVHKDTPADVRAKIEAVAKKVMSSDKAKKLSADTGALVYWKGADESAKQIKSDIETLKTVEAIIGE